MEIDVNCSISLRSYPGERIGLKFIPSESELFRAIPKSVSEPFRVIRNKSEKRFVSHIMKNDYISIPLQFE